MLRCHPTQKKGKRIWDTFISVKEKPEILHEIASILLCGLKDVHDQSSCHYKVLQRFYYLGDLLYQSNHSSGYLSCSHVIKDVNTTLCSGMKAEQWAWCLVSSHTLTDAVHTRVFTVVHSKQQQVWLLCTNVSREAAEADQSPAENFTFERDGTLKVCLTPQEVTGSGSSGSC